MFNSIASSHMEKLQSQMNHILQTLHHNTKSLQFATNFTLPWLAWPRIMTTSGQAMRWSSPHHQEIPLSSQSYFQPWDYRPPQLFKLLATKFESFLIQCLVHYGGNPFLEKNLDNFIVIDSELLSQLLAWKFVLANSSM